jgi:hypothetical protein
VILTGCLYLKWHGVMIKNLNIETTTEQNQLIAKNIYELDLALWRSLKELACQAPNLATHQFQITAETAQHFAQADEEKLGKLASKTLLSFKIRTSEKELIDYLKQSSNLHREKINLVKQDLNFLYWHTVKKIMITNADIALLRFDISPELAEAIAQANDGQLIQLATTIPPFSFLFAMKKKLRLLSWQVIAIKTRLIKKIY